MFRRLRILGLNMATALRYVLIGQAIIAALLVLGDLEARWTAPQIFESDRHTGPISPGDQVRRYDPDRVVPDYTNRPKLEIPETFEERLTFQTISTERFGTVLLMHGPITSGDAKRLVAFLDTMETDPDVVALNSPGGIVDEALEIGRELRSWELGTAVLDGMICASACPYVLAGGTSRKVSEGSAVGLHQHYYETPGYIPAAFAVEDIQLGQARTMAYLIEMGVDPGVMLHSLSTPPEDIYVLLSEELVETGLATEILLDE
jgi:hypothetical protein